MIVQQAEIDGSGKGASGWFTVRQVNVSYDHPYHVPLEHALNIDFVNEREGPGARVAVELTAESARHLIQTIQAVLARAETGGYVEGSASTVTSRVNNRAIPDPSDSRS
jgi:hypothetical protein